MSKLTVIYVIYSKGVAEVILSKRVTSIIDSYKVKSIRDMIFILKKARVSCTKDYAIHTRSLFGMINEWRAHNLLYNLYIKRPRTKDVDLDIEQNIFIKIAYAILSILYF